MHAACTWLIADALDKAGMEVPFPQTDIRLRIALGLEDEAALEKLGYGEGPRVAAPKPRRAPSANEAAEDVMARGQTALESDPPPPDPASARKAEVRSECPGDPQDEPHVGGVLGHSELEIAVQAEPVGELEGHAEGQGPHLQFVGLLHDVVQFAGGRTDV